MQDYNHTLQLPNTDFPMRASLPKREPAWADAWKERGLYHELVGQNKGRPPFHLHDGPPYANAAIHMGHALNKVLKDFIIRYKNMAGYYAPHTPGWDTHGLPIEKQVIEKMKVDRKSMSTTEYRGICRDYALKYIGIMQGQLERLGILSDFDKPYITLDPAYEAEQIRIFGAMAAKGHIYKGLRPVYWCAKDETALAEAEVEYVDEPCDSVYVAFDVTGDSPLPPHTSFVIWTTTTWTLPGNVAICLSPDDDYAVVRVGEKHYVIAEALTECVAKVCSWRDYQIVTTYKGSALERIETQHPFLGRKSLVILGSHVTMEAGTGCVHTAPGHGAEDFVAVKPYGLPTPVPVNNYGRMTAEAGEPFAGLTTKQAGKAIAEALQASGHLLASQAITHSYPHCWRCKTPILFRATEQWFCSLDSVKPEVEKAVRGVKWIPGWGEERMLAMALERSNWCISRQRQWGVPIPAFSCESCNKFLITDEIIETAAALIAAKGSDAWWETPSEEILPAGAVCDCGGAWVKETDIMDVWFDSGSSHAAVMKARPYLGWPADLYIEGNDQFRGWFQSSLLTSMIAYGQPPYRAVICHGMIIDEEARKMSKSLGNGIPPEDIVRDYGADILRLWVSSTDYTADVKISKDLLKQIGDIYLKVRNTARFILGNLSDYQPCRGELCSPACNGVTGTWKDTQCTPLQPLDKYILSRYNDLVKTVRAAYDNYEFHLIFHAVHNFCVIDLSNFYLDIIKDLLYCDAKNAPSRRGAQRAMYTILHGMTRLLAPILAFTSEEIWDALPHRTGDPSRALLAGMPSFDPTLALSEDAATRWVSLRSDRAMVNQALEEARAAGIIGKALDAEVVINAPSTLYPYYERNLEELRKLCIVSSMKIQPAAGEVSITVAPAPGRKCARCWVYAPDVGTHKLPDLCARCFDVVEAPV